MHVARVIFYRAHIGPAAFPISYRNSEDKLTDLHAYTPSIRRNMHPKRTSRNLVYLFRYTYKVSRIYIYIYILLFPN